MTRQAKILTVIISVYFALMAFYAVPTFLNKDYDQEPLQVAHGFTGANITDGVPRIAVIEQEDFSIEVYQTVNGTTSQIAGYDNFQDFLKEYSNSNRQQQQHN